MQQHTEVNQVGTDLQKQIKTLSATFNNSGDSEYPETMHLSFEVWTKCVPFLEEEFWHFHWQKMP